MRLTFFGSSLVSSYWNGAATYYRGLLRALHGLGHEITFCEPDAYGRQEHRDLAEDPDYARVVVYRDEEERDALVDARARGERLGGEVQRRRGVGRGAGGGGRPRRRRRRTTPPSSTWTRPPPSAASRTTPPTPSAS